MSNPLNVLVPKPPPPGPDMRWGAVVGTAPLEVLLDGDTQPLVGPSTLVPLTQGDRVFVLVDQRRATVLGATAGRATSSAIVLARLGQSMTLHTVRWAFIGDSETAGASLGSAGAEYSWPAILLRRIEPKMKGWVYRADQVSAFNPDTRWTLTNCIQALGRIAIQAGGEAIFAGTEATTEVQITYNQLGLWVSPRGQVTVYVDGVNRGTITPNNASSSFGVWTLTGLTLAPHTVRVVNTDASNRDFDLVSIYQGVAGQGVIRINAGAAGTGLTDWLDQTWHGTLYWTAMQGLGGLGALDIVFVSLGVNDYYNTDLETWKTRMQTLLDRIKLITPAIVMVIQPPASDQTSWPLWRAAQREIASLNGIAAVDIGARWGDYASANAAGLYADPTHPSQAGYYDMAVAVQNMLGY